MNIRALANSATSRVNPNISVEILISRAPEYADDGTIIPDFDPIQATAQMQPAPSQDLLMIDGRTAGSVYKIFYITGNLSGLSAPKPADKIIAAGHIYKVVSQPEGWSATAGWTKVLAEQEAEYDEDSDSDAGVESSDDDDL